MYRLNSSFAPKNIFKRDNNNIELRTNITDLPEGCISYILSLTSPKDVFRSSVVSKQFLSASESDVVWNNFLPFNFEDILSQSSSPQFPQQFRLKKKQFAFLCNSYILFNNNTKSFALDKQSGKKCYMFGARALNIVWGDTPRYWEWKSLPESRFPEIAALRLVWWLLIEARVDPKILSPKTTYGAYFVYKLDDDHFGFESTPVKANVYEMVMEEDGSENPHPDAAPFQSSFYLKASGATRQAMRTSREKLPYARDDGWLEIEMGRYYVNDCIADKVMLKMTLKEIEQLCSKSGLKVQGIELRPLDNFSEESVEVI